MKRRSFLKTFSLSAVAAVAGELAAAPSKASQIDREAKPGGKPNVLFVVSDQHRAGLTKREGYPLDTSPALDRLAERGVAFDRAYCAAPLCVPSRISMLTGRWPNAHRVRHNDMADQAFYSKHLYQVAKDLGYHTGLAGKIIHFSSQRILISGASMNSPAAGSHQMLRLHSMNLRCG
jgi:glucan phosphoethanolaminetransferase (alkaline phosphatase superfamily)